MLANLQLYAIPAILSTLLYPHFKAFDSVSSRNIVKFIMITFYYVMDCTSSKLMCNTVS